MGPAFRRKKRLPLVVKVVAAAALLAIAGIYAGEIARVNGRSMEPALESGDRVVFEKLSVRRAGLKRFDIVVFKAPEDPDTVYIKRVIGLPDEVVQATGGRLLVNGVEKALPAGMESAGMEFGPVVVRPAHYFVVGDNCGDSVDSRQWGAVPRDYILGRAVLRFWPVGSMKIFGCFGAQEERVKDAGKGI